MTPSFAPKGRAIVQRNRYASQHGVLQCWRNRRMIRIPCHLRGRRAEGSPQFSIRERPACQGRLPRWHPSRIARSLASEVHSAAMTLALVVLAVVVVAALLAAAIAAQLWNAESNRMIARLTKAMPRGAARTIVPADLDTVPAPLARFLRERLPKDQKLIRRAQVWTSGEFLVRPGAWRPFKARQLFTVQPAGYVWDARVGFAPGLGIFVRDGLVTGEGSIRAAIAGLIPVAGGRGSPGLAAGAAHRFLAEALWFPTALLLNPVLRWVAMDERTARVV